MGDALSTLGGMLKTALADPGAVLFNTARIFSSVFEIVLAYILIGFFYTPRFSRRFPDTLLFAGTAGVVIAAAEYGGCAAPVCSAIACGLLSAILFAAYGGTAKRKLVGVMVYAVMLAVSHVGAKLLLTLLSAHAAAFAAASPELFGMAARNGLLILLALILSLAARRARFADASLPLWTALLAVPTVTLIAFSVFQQSLEALEDDARLLPGVYPAVAGLILVNVLVFILFGRLNRQHALRRETDLLRTQVAEQAKSIRRLETVYNRTRAFRHDIKNHILVLDLLARQGKTEELKTYLRELSGVIDESDYVRISGISAVDALLNVKMYEAQALSITTAFDVAGLEENGIAPADLCVILANALDNAIEGNARIDDPTRRFLRVKARGCAEYSVISVANPCDETPPRGADGRFSTRKPDTESHGLGLKSIENTVKKYNGETVARCEDGVFTLVARLNARDTEVKKP